MPTCPATLAASGRPCEFPGGQRGAGEDRQTDDADRNNRWTFNFNESPYGEIDIIEGASAHQVQNRISLHTCAQCSFDNIASDSNGVSSSSSDGNRNNRDGRDARSNCDLQADKNCDNPRNA